MRSHHVLLLLILLPVAAQASGLTAPQVGSPWSSPATADSAAVHWNPSLLAFDRKLEFLGSLGFTYLHLGYHRERRGIYQREDSLRYSQPLAPGDIDPAKTGWAEPVAASQFIPSGALFTRLGIVDGLAAGLGVYAGQGAIISLPEDGAQRWALQEASIIGLYVTPALAWEIVDGLSIGAGLNLVVGLAGIGKVADLAGTDLMHDVMASPAVGQANDFGAQAPPAVRELEALSRPIAITGATAFAVTFNAGLAYRPVDWVTLGVAYQHWAHMTFAGSFTMDMDHDLFTSDLAPQGLVYPPLAKGKAWLAFPFPPAIRAAVAMEPTDWLRLSLAFNWVFHSMLKAFDVTLSSPDLAQPSLGLGEVVKLSIPKGWSDTYDIDAVVGVKVAEPLWLGVRGGYHSPASPDETVDVASPDGHRLVLGLLGDLALTDYLSLALDVRWHHILQRTVQASDFDLANGIYSLDLLTITGSLAIQL